MDWKREIYIKCTYNGIQLSEREFPQKWLTDGIQIKILFPSRLKPWHKSKIRCNENKKKIQRKKKNFCFLPVSPRLSFYQLHMEQPIQPSHFSCQYLCI